MIKIVCLGNICTYLKNVCSFDMKAPMTVHIMKVSQGPILNLST